MHLVRCREYLLALQCTLKCTVTPKIPHKTFFYWQIINIMKMVEVPEAWEGVPWAAQGGGEEVEDPIQLM